MPRRVVECVPNFSEGRNTDTVQEIAESIRRVPGILLLGQEQDADHHRAVITYVGSPEAVAEAAVLAARVAAARIDLREHRGVHPRIGALDVLPFIPVQNITLAECAVLARQTAQAIWERCGIPCYLYEAAALREDRRNLADIRRGGFEGLLADATTHPERRPDVGGPTLHPTAGAVAVGARKFLIAWNVLLRTEDLGVARSIAAMVRQSSGGFPFVKALGLPLPSRGITQVSMNLLDFEETPMQTVFDAIRREAENQGVEVIGSELIGFLPRRALEANLRDGLRLINFHPDSVIENRIESLAGARYAQDTAAATGDAESCYRQSLDLLAQASAWAARAVAEFPPQPGGFDWQQASHEVRQALESLEQDQSADTGASPAGGNQRGLEGVLLQAERGAALKTRLATERQCFPQPDSGATMAGAYDAIWHMVEASLHFALLAIQGLCPAEEEPAAGQRDSDAARIRALRSLIARR